MSVDSIGRCEVGSWLRDVLRDATSFTRVAHLEVKDLSAFLAAPPGLAPRSDDPNGGIRGG